MNELQTIFSSAAAPASLVQTVAWTLLHFLWQGTLVALVAAGALGLLRRRSAAVRYVVACGALLAMAILPVGTFLAFGPEALPAGPVETGAVHLSAATPAPELGAGLAVSVSPTSQLRLEPILPWLVGLWLAGVIALSLAHCGGWAQVRRLRHEGVHRVRENWQQTGERLARRLGIRRPVRLLESSRVLVPTVIGWLKPVVLLPASTFSGLSPQQLESIIAHELAHVRRHDYLVNTLQVIVETLLFYHPAVWWASRQVRDLREHCCDDLAVEVCGDRMVYARALADLEELRFATPVFALRADGGSLLARIRRLAGNGEDESRAPGWLAGTLLAVALVVTTVVFALGGDPGLAQQAGDEDQEPTKLGAPGFPVLPIILAQVPDDTEDVGPGPGTTRSAPARPVGDSRWTIDELIEMKTHGVDDLLEDLEGTPYADLPMAQLVELAKFGVDEELITELRSAGFDNLSMEQLVELAKFGADGDYIQEMRAAGYNASSTEELVELAKFGVDEELITELRSAGFDNLSKEQLVELAKFGVDGDYIQEMRAAGYDASSTEELAELAKFGVDEELITELQSAGFERLAADELIELAKFGVDGDYIQEMRAAGYDASSTGELVQLAKFGVDEELIAELRDAGYGDLGAEQLVELAKFGVDGDFIRELRDAGIDNLSLKDLIRMARSGVDAEFIARMSRQPGNDS